MYPDYGIYQAIVTDNTDFFRTGKIKVRIQSFYNGKFEYDLTKNFEYNRFFEEIFEDMDCYVYTPVGGGHNYGFFSLPQINSVGLVQFINGNVKLPIWMGSFFRPEYDEKGNVVLVNIPNDNKEYEGAGSDGIIKNSNEDVASKKISGDKETIILRTKSTSIADKNSAKQMDFNEQNSENLVVFSKEKLNLMHFSEWEREKNKTPKLKKWEEINFSKDEYYENPKIEIKSVSLDKSENQKLTNITLTDEELSLKVTDEVKKLETTITSTDEEINIQAKDSDNGNVTNIKQTAARITLINDTVTLLIEKNGISISVPNGSIRLSGKEVYLGEGGGYVAIKDNTLPSRMEDGSILKGAPNVRA